MWEGMDAERAMQVYHWTFLAQPAPMPERADRRRPGRLARRQAGELDRRQSLKPFDPRALAHYRAFFNNPDRIHALCEDYRAGATARPRATTRRTAMRARPSSARSLAMWGDAGIPAASSSPLDAWRATFAPKSRADSGRSGHFVAEENPGATLDLLIPFLTA